MSILYCFVICLSCLTFVDCRPLYVLTESSKTKSTDGILFLPSVIVDPITDLPTVTVTVLVDTGADFVQIETISNIIRDQHGRDWRFDDPPDITFSRSNNRLEYPLTFDSNYQNAYQVVETAAFGGPCHASKICCTDGNGRYQVNSMAHNATVIEVYKIGDVAARYDASVSISSMLVGGETVQFDDVTKMGGVAAFSASGRAFNLPGEAENVFKKRSMVVTESETFIAPSFVFGDSIRSIGMSLPTFLSATAVCAVPYGYYFAVDGGSPWDQLSKFRANTLDGALAGCTLLNTTTSAVSFDCQDTGTFFLTLQISATQYGLRQVFGQPELSQKGYLPFDDNSGEVVLDIRNDGAFDSNPKVIPKYCCFGGATTGCTADKIQPRYSATIAPGAIVRFSFLVRGPTPAFCMFDITEVNQLVIADVRVDLVATLGVFATTQSACSADQSFAQSICYPVDCTLKYGGTKNFYDVRLKQCVEAPTCKVYDNINNVCLEFLDPFDFPAAEDEVLESNCVHGDVVNDVCVCHSYAFTDDSQLDWDFKLCNSVKLFNVTSTGILEGDIGIIPLVILLAFVVILLSVFICCICCCCKRCRTRQADYSALQRQHQDVRVAMTDLPEDARTVRRPAVPAVSILDPPVVQQPEYALNIQHRKVPYSPSLL